MSAESAVAATGDGGVFVPITPVRLFDTSGTRLAAGTVKTLPVSTTTPDAVSTGVPSSGVSAVVVDITAKDTSAANIYAYSADDTGTYSVLSVESGDVKDSNTVVVKLGANGKIALKVSAGSAEINVDVQGYFTKTSSSSSSGGFDPITPVRLVDTEKGLGVPAGKIAGGAVREVSIGGNGGIPTNATAVFANIKVKNATARGGLRAGPQTSSLTSQPSIVDFESSDIYDSGATLDIDSSGKLFLSLTSGASADVAIDVLGYFTGGSEGGSYVPLLNNRIWDSRNSSRSAIQPNEIRDIRIGGLGGIPNDGSEGAAMLTIVAQDWTNSSSLSITDANDTEDTGTRNLSFQGDYNGTPVQTTAAVGISGDGYIRIRNVGSATVTLLINVQGWFSLPDYADVGDGSDQTSDGDFSPAPRYSSKVSSYTDDFSIPLAQGWALGNVNASGFVEVRDSAGTLVGWYEPVAVAADGSAVASFLTKTSSSVLTQRVNSSATVAQPVTYMPQFASAADAAGDTSGGATVTADSEISDEHLAEPMNADGPDLSARNARDLYTVPNSATDDLIIKTDDATVKVGMPAVSTKPASVASGKATYASNGNSTSITVSAFDDGIQIATNILSASAPTSFVYDLTLPAGGHLEDLGGGLIAIEDSAGNALTYVAPPWATDANGNAVGTRYEISGSHLTQYVDHRSAGVTYPVTADPWFGFALVKSVHRIGSTSHHHTFQVTPTWWAKTQVAGYILGVSAGTSYTYQVGKAGWKEVRRKAGSRMNYNLGGLRDQYICHMQLWPAKLAWVAAHGGGWHITWNLDEARKNVSYASTLLSACNPAFS